jgi:hypothetical protein
MIDRLYSTSKAGELLGGLHPNDVLLLIRDGKLEAVERPVRGAGKRPRKFVKESALQRFIDGLHPPGGAKAEPGQKGKRRAVREAAGVTEYY